MRRKIWKQIGYVTFTIGVIFHLASLPVYAEETLINQNTFELSISPSGIYHVTNFGGNTSFTLYTLQQGTEISAPNDAFCQCIGLSFQYNDAMGLTNVEWNDIWISSKDLPGIVSQCPDKPVFQEYGGFIECNELVYSVVAFDDYGQQQGQFYYVVEDGNGNVPWEPFLRTGAIITPVLENTKEAIYEEDVNEYYRNTVFLGDSIIYGLSKYGVGENAPFMNNIQFLAVGGFSSNNALKPASGDNLHPVYQGKKRQVWESIAMMNPQKVFVFLGINDLNISGIEGSIQKYKTVISKILEKTPEVEIHLVSITYVQEGAGKGLINNDAIRQYNSMLQELALENNWGYMDIVTPLSDGNGNLARQYCSDGFVHQSKVAYQTVWPEVLRQYAITQLEGGTRDAIKIP